MSVVVGAGNPVEVGAGYNSVEVEAGIDVGVVAAEAEAGTAVVVVAGIGVGMVAAEAGTAVVVVALDNMVEVPKFHCYILVRKVVPWHSLFL